MIVQQCLIQQEKECVTLWVPTATSLGPHSVAELNELTFSVHIYSSFIPGTHICHLSHWFGSDPHVSCNKVLGTDILL